MSYHYTATITTRTGAIFTAKHFDDSRAVDLACMAAINFLQDYVPSDAKLVVTTMHGGLIFAGSYAKYLASCE